MGLAVTRHESGGWVVVTLDGDADYSSEAQLSAAMNQAHAASPWLIVNCPALSFCDSSFIRILVKAYYQAHDGGGALVVTGAQPQLERRLNMTGLDQILTLYASIDEVVS